jgi:hypothetical protein
MPNAVGAIDRIVSDHLFQIAQLAFRAANLQSVLPARNRDSSRVIPAILKAAQSIDDHRNYLLLTDVSNNSAHEQLPLLKENSNL